MQPLLQHCKRTLLTYRYASHSTLSTSSAVALQQSSTDYWEASSRTLSPTALYLILCPWLETSMLDGTSFADWGYLQARLCEQEAATAEQSACAQQLQEAVETGKGKLAESAAFMQKLQDEQSRAREQIAEYAAQVMDKQKLSMYAQISKSFHVS